jgi:hypothetical protein
MRALTCLLFGLLLQPRITAVPQAERAVSDQDFTVFREVLRAGLIPQADVGDPLSNRTDMPVPPVVSRTLRICAAGESEDDVTCIPTGALSSIIPNVRTEEVASFKNRNGKSRVIPQGKVITVNLDQVFGDDQTWTGVWSHSPVRRLPECAHFSTPTHADGEAAVYVNRVWNGRVYGWYVRLRGNATSWRISSKKLVWRSHPGA